MLHMDTNSDDFKTGNEARMDEQLLVKFFLKERPDSAASETEGRPMFKEVEYVEIRVAGKREVQACRPATYNDKQRFSKHYQMFKDRVSEPMSGTPLSEWPQIMRSQVEELAFTGVKTVEQLSTMADVHASKFHGGNSLKAKAVKWLEFAGESKLLAEKEALEKRLADMEEMMVQLTAPTTTATTAVEKELETVETAEPEATNASRRRRAK